MVILMTSNIDIHVIAKYMVFIVASTNPVYRTHKSLLVTQVRYIYTRTRQWKSSFIHLHHKLLVFSIHGTNFKNIIADMI